MQLILETMKLTFKTVQLILGVILLIVIFIAIRWSINKKIISEKRINSKSNNFAGILYNELQFLYHIEESGNKLILHSDKIEDSIAQGTLTIELRNKDDPNSIKITYHRKINLLGYFIILFCIAFGYVGVVIPIIIIQNTKLKTFREIDRIYTISKTI